MALRSSLSNTTPRFSTFGHISSESAPVTFRFLDHQAPKIQKIRVIVEAIHTRISRESVANQTLVVQLGAPSVAYSLVMTITLLAVELVNRIFR